MRVCFLFLLFVLAACGRPVDTNARILTMGDSLLSWNRGVDGSVSQNVERMLGQKVSDRSTPSARILPILKGTGIRSQYALGHWDWVILNGGGNDLWLGCGCFRCDGKLNRLISSDGQRGEIPSIVAQARKLGARVIYVGYLRSPGRGSLIEHCKDEGDALDARIARMAADDPGVYFVSNARLVPHGDASFHDIDRIHPSKKASAAIAKKIAEIIGKQ